jgi:hypothetical protein
MIRVPGVPDLLDGGWPPLAFELQTGATNAEFWRLRDERRAGSPAQRKVFQNRRPPPMSEKVTPRR